MRCQDWCHSYRPYASDGSFGSPEHIVLDFSPVTNITIVTQTANVLSIGGVAQLHPTLR